MASHPRKLVAAWCAIAAACADGVAVAQTLQEEEAPTFMALDRFATGLIPNVVRVAAENNHGFGLIVGFDRDHLYIVTALHVLSNAGSSPSSPPDITLCAEPETNRRLKGTIIARHDGKEDFAFIRVARPKKFRLNTRALAPESKQSLRDQAVTIGRADECVLNPSDSRISMLRDDDQNLRVEVPTGAGGDSGAPVATARGVIGIVRRSSGTALTLQSIAHIRQRAPASMPWNLVDSRNIPPTSPDAAHQDLTRTLNVYLSHARNVQSLLLQTTVDRAHFDEYAKKYAAAIQHYIGIRDVYDGTLNEYWPPEVLGEWKRVSADLWQVHQTFWELNAVSLEIFETGITPPETREKLIAVAPDIDRLRMSIAAFTSTLGTRRKSHAVQQPNAASSP